MYLSIIILPLLGSIVAGFFGRKVGVRGSQIITCSCVIVTTILALLAWVEVGFNNIPVTINLFRWIDSEWFNITWGFQFDALTVSFVGLLIEIEAVLVLIQLYKNIFIKKILIILLESNRRRKIFSPKAGYKWVLQRWGSQTRPYSLNSNISHSLYSCYTNRLINKKMNYSTVRSIDIGEKRY